MTNEHVDNHVFGYIIETVEELIDDEVPNGSQAAHGLMMMINVLA